MVHKSLLVCCASRFSLSLSLAFSFAINLFAMQQMVPRVLLASVSFCECVLLKNPFNKSILHWHLEIFDFRSDRWIRMYNCLIRCEQSTLWAILMFWVEVTVWFGNFVTGWMHLAFGAFSFSLARRDWWKDRFSKRILDFRLVPFNGRRNHEAQS